MRRGKWIWWLLVSGGAFVAAAVFLVRPPRDPVDAARRTLLEADRRHGGHSLAVASALDALVEALYASGQGGSHEALKHSKRAVEIKTAILGDADPSVARSLNNVGAVLYLRGEFREAVRVLQRSLEIRKRHTDRVALYESLNNLALFAKEAGDFALARSSFEEALAVLTTVDGLPEEDVGWRRAATWHNFGLLLHETGDLEEATRLLEKTTDYWEGRDASELANALNSLGRLSHDVGEYRLAQRHFERALSIWENASSPDPRRQADVLNNLGFLLHDVGERERARRLYHAALALRERVLGESHPDVAWTLCNLGLLLLELGEPDDAEPLFKRAFGIRREALAPDHPLIYHTLAYLATVAVHRGHSRRAHEISLAAEDIRRRGLLITLPVLEERRAVLLKTLKVFGLKASSLDLALTSLVALGDSAGSSDVGAVWDDLLRSRGLVLDEIVERRRLATASSDPETARCVEELARARQTLANLWVGRGSPEEIEEARRDKERQEATLARMSRAFRAGRERRSVGLEEVRRVLSAQPAGTLLLAFAKYNRLVLEGETGKPDVVPSYLAFVLSSGGESPRVVPLGDERTLRGLVVNWRTEILRGAAGGDEATYRTSGVALRQRVWDPLVRGLEDVHRVFLVPDGILHVVSFASLPAEGGSYLVETGPLLHYLTTEKDLLDDGSSALKRRPSGRLLALGRPAFGATTGAPDDEARGRTRAERARLGSASFEDLPGTEEEVREIAAIVAEARRREAEAGKQAVPGATGDLILLGPDAGESRFKDHAPGFRLLHLATHGFYLGTQDELALEDRSEETRGMVVSTTGPPSSSEPLRNPLLLSGLALAGANERGRSTATLRREGTDDGILTAEEIVSLDLSSTDWAVLSACKTGLGDILAGEGIFGLRRAFRLAGVASSILSLWPVKDQPTREWMAALYRARCLDGRSTPASVRQASLEVLRRRRDSGVSTHPFFWAAFVGAGSWR